MPLTKKVTVPVKYSDFAEIILKELVKVLPEQTCINEHAIKLEEGKQPPYKPVYSLGLVELETFKIYIETNLANSFIQLSKFPTSAPIFFVHKPNNSFCLYVNYRGLSNLIIKN